MTSPGSPAPAPPGTAADVERDLAELASIGRDAERGGWSRHLLDPAESAMREWFRRRAAASGLTVEADRNTNLWAWWGAPEDGAIVTGSHLDSVPGGGELDGPLGIVSAFAAVDRLRSSGVPPSRAVAVVAFAEEEGSRFGLACLGSKLLTGALEPAAARALTDAGGTTLAETLAEAGFDAAAIGRDDAALARIGVLVELHVEQGRALADLEAPVAVATSILAHGRWRIRFTGRGDHAGTAPMVGRHDPVVAAARATVAIRDAARRDPALRATVGRSRVVPGGTNVIAREATLWLDARGPDDDAALALVAGIAESVERIATDEGCDVTTTRESWSGEVRFDPATRARIRGAARAVLGTVPELATGAGHDAGVLAAHVPTAMLFVRNPTGVSHAPEESASPADRAAGVAALTAALRALL